MHYVTDTLFRYTLHSVLCIIGRTRWKCKTMQAQKCQSGPAGTGWHYDCCTPVPVYYHSIRFTYPHFSQNNNNFPTWMKNQTQNDTWAESRKANASVPSQVSHLGRQSGNLTIWFSSFNSSPDCPATICSLLFPRLTFQSDGGNCMFSCVCDVGANGRRNSNAMEMKNTDA